MSTGIAWTDETWNPLRARPFVVEAGKADGWHCEHVSEGCRNCYAETLNVTQRWDRGTGLAYTRPNREKVEVYLDDETLVQPLRWRKPRRVFVCSMTDLFGEWVADEQLDRVFAVMALTPHITYQLLTKRPERMRAYLQEISDFLARPTVGGLRKWRITPKAGWPLPNVWLGVSVEDQPAADKRIPELLATPAALRFLSCEPLLGPVGIRRYLQCRRAECQDDPFCAATADAPAVDWVILGGESGSGARPCDLAWVRSIVAQCKAAGVAVFCKQLGAHVVSEPLAWGVGESAHVVEGDRWRHKLRHSHGGNPDEWPDDLRVREFPGEATS